MTNKMCVGFMSLILAGTGLSVQKSGWFVAIGRSEPTTAKQAMVDPLTAAAARHARCQPLHWRTLMLQPR